MTKKETYCNQCGCDESFAHSTATHYKGDEERNPAWLCSHYCFNEWVGNRKYKMSRQEWIEQYDKKQRLKMKEKIENPENALLDEIDTLRKEVKRWKANATRVKNDLETYKRYDREREKKDAGKQAILEHKAKMYDEIMERTFFRKEV